MADESNVGAPGMTGVEDTGGGVVVVQRGQFVKVTVQIRNWSEEKLATLAQPERWRFVQLGLWGQLPAPGTPGGIAYGSAPPRKIPGPDHTFVWNYRIPSESVVPGRYVLAVLYVAESGEAIVAPEAIASHVVEVR